MLEEVDLAIHKSAIKRHRQSLVRRERNRSVKTNVRTVTKQALSAIESGDSGKIGETLKIAVSQIDKAASMGVIHQRTAARKISRLNKKAHRAQNG